jgi:hypothetical protein
MQRGVVLLRGQVCFNIWSFHDFENVLRQIVGWLLDNEWERMWKAAVMAYFERCPGICLQELRKIMTVMSRPSY